MVRSEGSRPIYSSHETLVVDEISGKNRITSEVGNIKGLEINEVVNYLLVPMRSKDENGKEITTAWDVLRVKQSADVPVVSYKSQEGNERDEK